MLLVTVDTDWGAEGVESTASTQLTIFLKIARALKLYCQYEGKRKKCNKGDGIEAAVMGRLHGDALFDDYDPLEQPEDAQEFDQQDFNQTFESLEEDQNKDDAEEEEEAESACNTTTYSKSGTNDRSEYSASHGSMTGSKSAASFRGDSVRKDCVHNLFLS